MVAYALPADRRDAVKDGAQTFLLQAPRRMPSRHARPGEAITLRPGGETLQTAPCVARALIHMDKAGIRRVLEIERLALGPGRDAADALIFRFVGAENGAADAPAQRDRLARDLGFEDYAALWRDQLKREDGRGKVSRGVIAREVIGWALRRASFPFAPARWPSGRSSSASFIHQQETSMNDTTTQAAPATEAGAAVDPGALGRCIVNADRGHVWAAESATFDDRWAYLKNARAVRRWGTTEGLNQLANEGPRDATRLDAAADLQVSLRALIAVIPCEAEKWSA